MQKSKSILAALKQLDVNNANHWTADGAPRLDTVHFLAGDKSISRDDVTSVAPGFSRAQPVLPGEQEAAAQPPNGPATPPEQAAQGVASAPAAQPPVQQASQGAATSNEPANTQPVQGGTDGKNESDAAGNDTFAQAGTDAPKFDELQAAQEAFNEAMARKVQADKDLAAAQKAVDSVIEAREKTRGQPTFVDAFQGYMKQQQKVREERAARIEALKGVPLKEILPSKSKIDEAFKRRTGRENKRPTRI